MPSYKWHTSLLIGKKSISGCTGKDPKSDTTKKGNSAIALFPY